MLRPSHLALTIHEIVAHARGWIASPATRPVRRDDFVKIADIGELKYRIAEVHVTADRTFPGGMATVGFDDDGVKSRSGRSSRTASSSGSRPTVKRHTS